jgi:tetratricopeptide (TPR) repeat protein
MIEKTGDACFSSEASAATKPGSPRTGDSATWLSLRRALRWTKRIVAVMTVLPTALVVVWILGVIAMTTFRRHSMDLQSLTVPKALADDGLSAEVVTRQLRDAINDVHGQATTTMAKTDVELQAEATSITIPKAGVSIESVAATLRRLLPGSWQHEVSGEFTQSGTLLSMRLRVNGRIVFTETTNGPDAPAILIKRGAFRLVEETEPFVAASWLYGDGSGDLAPADSAADRIILTFPAGSEIVARAYNLRGIIASSKGKLEDAAAFYAKASNLPDAWNNLGNLRAGHGRDDEAIIDYRTAIQIDPRYAAAHHDLGLIWRKQGKDDEATAEFRTAIQIEPKYAAPHYSLGNLWHEQGKDEEAIVEYRTASQIDPKYAVPHYGLGIVLENQGKDEEAIAEYRLASQIDPKFAAPHYALGNLWHKQGKDEEAITEYFTASQIDPKFELEFHSFGIELFNLALSETTKKEKTKRLLNACKVFVLAAKLAPADFDYSARLHEIDKQLPGAHCPPMNTAGSHN